MNTEIYYFSGTGNSLAVARSIAEKIRGRLIAIPSMMNQENIFIEADTMGLAFPVYHKSIPLILKRFVEKLTNLDKKYIFAVSTYSSERGMPKIKPLMIELSLI